MRNTMWIQAVFAVCLEAKRDCRGKRTTSVTQVCIVSTELAWDGGEGRGTIDRRPTEGMNRFAREERH